MVGGGGCRVVVVVVVVGRAVVVVVTAVVVVVVVSVVVVVDAEEDDEAEEEADEEDEGDDAVVPVTVIVRLGCSLRFTTTMSPPSPGWGGAARGDSATAQVDARKAATAAPIMAPKASRPGPPSAVSINYDYRPHSFGSNPVRHLVPARYFGYQAGTRGATVRRGSR
ncbi:hypothetical protein [Saccharothrix hoggarensis]|uniref:hypothetical protein n=1 Tax=Saccharothrix hoggarensis TaxID=913853 RepID=UPI0036D22B6C